MSIIDTDGSEDYLETSDQATERFEARRDQIQQVFDRLKKERSAIDLDTERRFEIRRKLIHPNDGLALERIIGESDLLPTNYLEQGLRAARSVCRIQVRDRSGRRQGFGTGFLIGPNLVMTNNHVLRSPEHAMRTLVDFNYEDDIDFIPRVTATFPLLPGEFFHTNEDLDVTVCAVRETAIDGTQLVHFGYLPMVKESGKGLLGEPVSIIQHPNGQTKQVALRSSTLIDVEESGPFIRYTTDTLPGSSGAPVFNDQWEVVALHRAGVKKRNAQNKVLTKEGRIWKPEMGPEAIEWLANEGVRISRIVDMLQTEAGGAPQLTGIFENARPGLTTMVARSSLSQPRGPGRPAVTVHADPVPAPAPEPAEYDENHWEVGDLEDYQGSLGYDPEFLDTPVPLPTLSEALQRDLAPLKHEDGHELRYVNFSVVMNKARRLAFYTACNIDGRGLKRPKRPRGWRIDPRMEHHFQADNALYKHNPLDRGHLVRRLDPVWGPDFHTANRDTFHYTNAAPQHQGLNQKTWLQMEDYIINNATNRNKKVTVFTGPVFRADDIVYRNHYQIPAEYWKVVALDTGDGLRAVGYLQTQKNLIGDLELAFGDSYRTYAVPITTIEALTQIDFGDLRNHDPIGDIESTSGREVTGPDDIIL